ncbi:MAG: phosphoribosylformylglycinamidine cyclo-ligase [Nitrospirae bacterium]|nr:phosphoribosylformylglycinamidine cyclo-ligase [Candidatus Troglogloeales bacterium]MBI3598977.1 phosphoribosylformylglycinamidine cyclo-ligase [Candidatus Troglogloeales bacterium]
MSSTYKSAGVDIEAGEQAMREIGPIVRSTYSKNVITELGGYAGLFALPLKKIKNPILVASTDGVGTKLKIAQMMDRHDTIGIDLVAMSVNDIIVSGATPLFFLDYFATGKLSPEKMAEVVRGIANGCKEADCALIGGETAEMPSFYQNGAYDIAGFAVGVVDKMKRINREKIRAGDLLIGLASSGLHSNGYSLARKIIFEKMGMTVIDKLPGLKKRVGETLLTPTKIYVKTVLNLARQITIKGAAHITGGGMTRNIPRTLPDRYTAKVYPSRWELPEIFKIIEKEGGVDRDEMFRTFNMGVGMVLVIDPKDEAKTISILKKSREKAWVIGEVIPRKTMTRVIYQSEI